MHNCELLMYDGIHRPSVAVAVQQLDRALECEMSCDDKSRLIAVGSNSSKSTPEDVKRLLSSIKPMRSPEALEPIVRRVVANTEVMQKYHAAAGHGDDARAEVAIDAILAFAQTIDATITRAEAARIAVAMMKMHGYPAKQP